MPAKIRVTAIQRLCVNDGPGVRIVVFLKGCYLQCPWCCNPEAIHYDEDEYFDKGNCKYPERNPICKNCELHGGLATKDRCPFGAFEKTYKDYRVEELFSLLMRDATLYRDGGGVTFSGGEPLLQAIAIAPLLQRLKDEKIHIAFETTLYAPSAQYNAAKEYVDYWLVDLKFQFGYMTNKDYTVDANDFEANLQDLQSSQKDVIYRMVVMEEMMEKASQIVQRLKGHGIDGIELLSYHGLAESKYKELGRAFKRFRPLSDMESDEFSESIRTEGINVVMMKL